MRRRSAVAVAVALMLSASLAHAQSVFLVGRVIGILDGDTLDVLIRDDTAPHPRALRIRLSEIDAPEKGQAFGQKAKESLSSICFNRRALVRVDDVDRYGRTVGRVWCDALDANAYQVEKGMAWFFTKYGSDLALVGAEIGARERRAGLWADARPVPPWVWRDAQRGR